MVGQENSTAGSPSVKRESFRSDDRNPHPFDFAQGQAFRKSREKGGAPSRSAYTESPLFLRNAGTSKSACSKFAIMAVRMLSSEMTSPEADGADCGDSITIDGAAGSESKSSSECTVNPVDSLFRRGRSSSLNPVAMTVIFTASFIFSSNTAPKIMLASS